jgi:hypothetical protein
MYSPGQAEIEIEWFWKCSGSEVEYSADMRVDFKKWVELRRGR